MGGKDGRDRQTRGLQVQQAGSGLPLMELGHDLVRGVKVEAVETFYHLSGGETEEGILLVIPVSGY